MVFIWSPQALENLFLHWSEDVQRWAIGKALELHPDVLRNQVIGLIPSVSTDRFIRTGFCPSASSVS